MTQSVAFSGGAGPKNREEQEDLLIKAKTLLFEKSKVCKHQETKIEALQAQVESLKTVVGVTKDMVNLKTAEMNHMESRWESSNARLKAEQDKGAIFEKKFITEKIFDLFVAYEKKIIVIYV